MQNRQNMQNAPSADHSSGVLVLPSKPSVNTGANSVNTQASRRYTDTFFDIHKSARFPNGRPWTGEREIAANHELMHEDGFCSPDLQQGEYVVDDVGTVDRAATFASVWSAPWLPIPKYFKFNYRRKQISFDYPAMRLHEKQGLDKYYAAAAKLGAEMNRAVEYGVVPHFQITSILGEPTKLVKIAEAAMAGDPWLLGHVDTPNVELAALLGHEVTYIGSYTPDAAHVMRPVRPAPEPVVTPDQVLATPSPDLLKMLAEIQQQLAEQRADLASMRAAQSHSAKTKAGMAKAAATKAGTHAA